MRSGGNNLELSREAIENSAIRSAERRDKGKGKKRDPLKALFSQEPQFIEIESNQELRCPNPKCQKLLGVGDAPTGKGIEIKCPRCKTMARFQRL